MGFNLLRAAKDFALGDIGGVIGEVADGLGVKSKEKIKMLEGVGDQADKIIDIINGTAKQELLLDAEFRTKIAELEAKNMEEYYKYLQSTEATAREMPKFVQIFRGMVRPIITYLAMGTTMWCIYIGVEKSLPVDQMIPGPLGILDTIIMGFWFGGRAFEHIIDRVGSNGLMGAKPGVKKSLIS